MYYYVTKQKNAIHLYFVWGDVCW